MKYKNEMRSLLERLYDGIDEFAESLYDFDGLILDPIGEMEELTSYTDEIGDIDKEQILEKLEQAANGAYEYNEQLNDTDRITEPISEIEEIIGIEW